MKKQELFNAIESLFKEQLNLEISDVVVLHNDCFVLKMELMALSIGSLKLQLTQEEHGMMADFLTLVMNDSKK